MNVVNADFSGVQEPIPDLEKALDMAAILLSGNIEDEIVKSQSKKMGPLPITFENVYAELDRGEIILLKPTLKRLPDPILHQLKVKLEANHIVVDAEWKNVTVHASYESYYERGMNLPIRIDGELSFRWKKVRAYGHVGIFVVNDTVQAVNNDIVYDFDSLVMDVVDHNSEHVTEDAVIDACTNIASKLYWDLRWELRMSIEAKINEFLADFKLSELFRTPEDVSFYRAATESFTKQANSVVDGFLKSFQKAIREKHIKKVPLKNMAKYVDAKLGIVSLQGNFTALDGFAGDLSSIERVGDFSIWTPDEDGPIQLTGYIQFRDFSASYNHYEATAGHIQILGKLRASTIYNLVALKMLLVPDSKSPFGYNLTVDNLKDVRLGYISVHITGMGPLDNFVSLIASIVLNHFKADLIGEINKNLNYIMDKITKGSS
ncbi:unnamed protein product [Hermetia illucens]|uniref:Uncharacterized protein n=2 Tax=Hermetia illucens TaxID=343691 RepID=A0A7R8Z2K3_HERIL|nr:unnamed protein product [Hermetia illucens]